MLRRVGGEPEKAEVKAATGGFPDSLRATLSAFSNTDGGTVPLGGDERQGFEIDSFVPRSYFCPQIDKESIKGAK